MCRRVLVADRTEHDPEAVVGDEAHIAGRLPGSTRYGECDPSIVDAYENRMLLCKVDHKTVDDQWREFTCDRLHRIKADHEAWVETTLADVAGPIRLEPHPTDKPLQLTLLNNGGDVWDLVAPAHLYRFADLAEDDGTDDEHDLTAEFLQLARDWGEVGSDVIDSGAIAIRGAKRSLNEGLATLTERGLVVFGCPQRKILKGGVGPPALWHEAVLQIVRADDSRIVAQPLDVD